MIALIAAAALAGSSAGSFGSTIEDLKIRPFKSADSSGCLLTATLGERTIVLETSVRKHWRNETALLVLGVEPSAPLGTRTPAKLSLTYQIGDKSATSPNRAVAEWVNSDRQEGVRLEGMDGLLRPTAAKLNGQSHQLVYNRLVLTIEGQTLVDLATDAKFHAGIQALNACTAKQEPFDPHG